MHISAIVPSRAESNVGADFHVRPHEAVKFPDGHPLQGIKSSWYEIEIAQFGQFQFDKGDLAIRN